MKSISIRNIVLLLTIVTINCYAETTTITAKNLGFRHCQKQKNGQNICFCGKNKVIFDHLKDERCINGKLIQKSHIPKLSGLRLKTKAIHQSTRDDNKYVRCAGLQFKPQRDKNKQAYVPLQNVSVEAWIDSFTADVYLTQVFVNQEENPIEAIYVFPIEVCSNIENNHFKQKLIYRKMLLSIHLQLKSMIVKLQLY